MAEKERDVALIRHEPTQMPTEYLSPVMDLTVAKARLSEFQAFVKEYLREEEDYGTIPGTPKPTLYKPGADKLCELYGLSDDYQVVNRIEDWDKLPSLFDYEVKCILRRGNRLVSTGMGSCNSWEGKYRWREAKRKCPKCGKEAIIRGKEEFGGGWLCWKKQDGCGAKYGDDAPGITGQEVGRIPNDDIATLKNTILKMAKKRAKIDATLAATRSSGIFTQDVEDFPSQAVSTVPMRTVNATVIKPNGQDDEPATRTIEVTPEPPVEEDNGFISIDQRNELIRNFRKALGDRGKAAGDWKELLAAFCRENRLLDDNGNPDTGRILANSIQDVTAAMLDFAVRTLAEAKAL